MFIRQQWSIYEPNWSINLLIQGVVLGVFVLTLVIVLHIKKGYQLWRILVALILYIFLFIVLSSTVLSRRDYGYYNYNVELFWSYRVAIESQGQKMLKDIVLNVLLLFPVGILFPIAVPIARFKHTFLFGMFCSGIIEILQLVLQRGLFELDDIVHNTLGTCIGYALFWLVRKCIKK